MYSSRTFRLGGAVLQHAAADGAWTGGGAEAAQGGGKYLVPGTGTLCLARPPPACRPHASPAVGRDSFVCVGCVGGGGARPARFPALAEPDHPRAGVDIMNHSSENNCRLRVTDEGVRIVTRAAVAPRGLAALCGAWRLCGD